LKVAAVLITRRFSGAEARYRSSINRSYYAAYGEAREFCLRHGWTFVAGRGGSHDQVWNFLRHGQKARTPGLRAAWKSIGDSGLYLKSQRVIADYHRSHQIGESLAQQIAVQAEQLIARLDKLP
jgi:hypothetical protein